MPTKPRPVSDRFWEKVDRSGGPDACWPWTAFTYDGGYGMFGVGVGRTAVRAHRMAWELTHGDPGPALVLHKCDNKGCCNPKHLYLGDHAQNMKDAKDRLRHPRGEKNHKTKLTEAQVLEMHSLHSTGFSSRALAKMYGVHQSTVSDLLAGRTWRHVCPIWA